MKRLYFHHAVEMKQPDTMTEPTPKAHGRPRHHHPTAPIGGQKILSGHSRIEAPTGGKRPAKVPIKPEGSESRTAHYQIGDIRSYLFNNITFYRAFLQSPHSRLPTRLPPPLLPGWMSRKSKPGGAPRPPRCGYPPSARIGFFCLIQRIKSFSACILQRVSLRLSLQGYGDA